MGAPATKKSMQPTLRLFNLAGKCESAAETMHFFAHAKMASALCGTEYPVVLTSRTDSPEGKYNSILVAVMQAVNA